MFILKKVIEKKWAFLKWVLKVTHARKILMLRKDFFEHFYLLLLLSKLRCIQLSYLIMHCINSQMHKFDYFRKFHQNQSKYLKNA
jgi:hypothetical protein